MAVCGWLNESGRVVEFAQRQGLEAPDQWEASLPTEAQWEYACRAGSETEYYSGDGKAALAEVGWYDGNSENRTHAVDEKAEEHPFGLCGMHGNVWEWCRDVWDAERYRKVELPEAGRAWALGDAGEDAEYLTNEDRANKSPNRVLRGGSWDYAARHYRSALRVRYQPGYRAGNFGFRLALVPGPVVVEAGQQQARRQAGGKAAGRHREPGRGTSAEASGGDPADWEGAVLPKALPP